MFDSLAEKLQGTLAGVRQRGALTEEDISRAMREIRLALLEADVNFKVVKQFTSTVKERALGIEVQKQLNPGQQVIKIVNEELTSLMGGSSAGLSFSPRPPTVILMAGLQGSGKTTATAKLAKLLKEQNGSSVAVAACDVYRPAAVEQLIKVGGQAGATVYEQEAAALEKKLRKNQFTLEDFLDQLKRIRKMGPLTSLLGMIAGLAGHQLSKLQVDERELDRVEAIILSMTPEERRRPELIKGSRRLRIAKGSGTTVQQVNQLVKQFGEMRKMMKGLSSGKMPDLGQLMRQR